MRKINRRKLSLSLVIAFALFIVPMYSVHAALFDIGTFAATGVLGLLTYLVGWSVNVASVLIAFGAKLLGVAVYVRAGGDIPVVAGTWKILRDFSNMVFIILLIYMAFSTIFDRKGAKFGELIVRFIIVAVMINFSLVVGNLVIDACQVLSNVFLAGIGDLGARLGQYMNVNALMLKDVNAVDVSIASLGSALIILILALIFLFSIGTAALFAIIRIPYIWGLLIVSPIAWMSFILPGTQKWWKMWWGQFRGWNLFLPVYLFFMYLGLTFLSKKDEILSAVVRSHANGGDPTGIPLLGDLSQSLTFNLIFFYIFAAFVLIGGTKAAVSTTSMVGTGFDAGYKRARSWMGRMSGYDVRRDAVKAAATAKLGEFQQKGFENKWLNKVYGGKEGDQRIQGKYAQVFGVRNAAESRMTKEVSAEKSRLQDKDTRVLQSVLTDQTAPERRKIAAREILKDRNQLSGSQIVETYELYAKDNPQSALKFAGSVDYGKLSKDERGMLYDRIDNVELKKKISGTMAEKGDLNDVEKLKKATTLFNPVAEKSEFLKKAQKKSLLAATNARIQLGLAKNRAGQPQSLEEALFEQVNNMQPKDLVDLDKGTWEEPAFRNAVARKLELLQTSQKPKRNKKGNLVPGGGDNFKNSLRKAAAGDQDKLGIIETIAFAGENRSAQITGTPEDDEEEEPTPEAPTGGGTPPAAPGNVGGTAAGTAGTVSYNGSPINRANIVDLRNKSDIEIK